MIVPTRAIPESNNHRSQLNSQFSDGNINDGCTLFPHKYINIQKRCNGVGDLCQAACSCRRWRYPGNVCYAFQEVFTVVAETTRQMLRQIATFAGRRALPGTLGCDAHRDDIGAGDRLWDFGVGYAACRNCRQRTRRARTGERRERSALCRKFRRPWLCLDAVAAESCCVR